MKRLMHSITKRKFLPSFVWINFGFSKFQGRRALGLIIGYFVLLFFSFTASISYIQMNSYWKSSLIMNIKDYSLNESKKVPSKHGVSPIRREIPIVIVICAKEFDSSFRSQQNGSSFQKSKIFRYNTVLLKSVAIATKQAIRIVIASNNRLIFDLIQKNLSRWPIHYQKKLTIEFQKIDPIPECNFSKPCIASRLFMHEILPEEESIIYVDNDFIFLESPEKLPRHFENFEPQQLMAAVPNYGQYENPFVFHEADYYYHGNTGICSGILLINLTRIRELPFNWTETMDGLCQSYKGRLKVFDQGILNIFFSEFPEKIYLMDCRWNFFVNNCNHNLPCKEVESNGNIFAVHGAGDTFRLSRKMKTLFESFENFDLQEPVLYLNESLGKNLRRIDQVHPESKMFCYNFLHFVQASLQDWKVKELPKLFPLTKTINSQKV